MLAKLVAWPHHTSVHGLAPVRCVHAGQTIRNNNSSRFGKHFDIQLDANGRILGAHTSCYLLEKPRICVHLEQERNYHVFYMLCKADPSIRQPVQIGEWPMYQICNQKGTVERVETWDDEEEFCAMHAALLKLGFKESERESLYRMISLVLNLGNLALDAGTPTRVRDRDLLDDCAVMLQVSAAQLEHGAPLTFWDRAVSGLHTCTRSVVTLHAHAEPARTILSAVTDLPSHSRPCNAFGQQPSPPPPAPAM